MQNDFYILLFAMFQRIHDFFFGTYSARIYRIFLRRFVFSFGIYMVYRVPYMSERLTSDGFHYTKELKNRRHYNPFPLLPSRAKIPFAVVTLWSVVSYLLWRKQRLMMWIIAAIAIYIQFADQAAAFTLNKYYIVFFTISALMLSQVDIRASNTVPAWWVRVIQITLLIQYFTAGTCKIMHGDWLVETSILWTQVQWLYCTDFAAMLLREYWSDSIFWTIWERATLIFEIWAPLFFILPRTRKLWIILGIWFHIFIAVTMSNLIYFSLQLMVIYILFLDEEDIDKMKKLFLKYRNIFLKSLNI